MGLRKGQTNSTSFKKGIIPWIKGKHHSEKSSHKMSLSRIGKKLSPESIQKRTETRRRLYLEGKLVGGMKGKHQSEEAKKKIGEASKNRRMSDITRKKISGKNSYLWKGGITSLHDYIRNSLQYKRWVCSCMIRDNWTCIICKKRGGDLHAHHIVLFSDILKEHNIRTKSQARLCKELWDINNGITLCEECHKLTHKYLKSVQNQLTERRERI